MEEWKEVFKDSIPADKYQTQVNCSEEKGLNIKLVGTKRVVNIEFGAVSAYRVFDEGIVLSGLFDIQAISPLKSEGFSNTIYEVINGDYSRFIKTISSGLFDYLGMRHYAIITQNYIIETITEWKPNITIEK